MEVEVQPVVVKGSRGQTDAGAVASDFRQANEIYEQCCIRVVNLGVVTVPKSKDDPIYKLLPGGELWTKIRLQDDVGRLPLSPAEVALTGGQTRRDIVYAYYVKEFQPQSGGVLHGLAYIKERGTFPPAWAFVVNDRTQDVQKFDSLLMNTNVWSHELGHILLNEGTHVDKVNQGRKGREFFEPNLMSGAASSRDPQRAWVLAESQCKKMRRSTLVKPAFLRGFLGILRFLPF
jgi:hypothetical protein